MKPTPDTETGLYCGYKINTKVISFYEHKLLANKNIAVKPVMVNLVFNIKNIIKDVVSKFYTKDIVEHQFLYSEYVVYSNFDFILFDSLTKKQCIAHEHKNIVHFPCSIALSIPQNLFNNETCVKYVSHILKFFVGDIKTLLKYKDLCYSVFVCKSKTPVIFNDVYNVKPYLSNFLVSNFKEFTKHTDSYKRTILVFENIKNLHKDIKKINKDSETIRLVIISYDCNNVMYDYACSAIINACSNALVNNIVVRKHVTSDIHDIYHKSLNHKHYINKLDSIMYIYHNIHGFNNNCGERDPINNKYVRSISDVFYWENCLSLEFIMWCCEPYFVNVTYFMLSS